MHMNHDVSVKQADDGTYIVSCRDNSVKASDGPHMEEEEIYTASDMKEVTSILTEYFSGAEKKGKDREYKKGMGRAMKEEAIEN